MEKPIYKSKTIIAAFAFAVIAVLQFYGVDLPYDLVYKGLGAFGVYGIRDAISANK